MSAPFINLRDQTDKHPLDELFLPDSVVATKASHLIPDWSDRAGRSLHHDVWQIVTSDPEKVRRRDLREIRFDSNISYGRMLLSDTSLSSDKLTKKILCARALTFGVFRKPITSLTLYRIALTYDWVLRWRVACGIEHNQDLRQSDFEAYLEALRADNVLALVPIAGRIERLANDVLSGKWQFPIAKVGSASYGIDWTELAALLGVTGHALATSREVREILRDLIPRIGGLLGDDRLNSLILRNLERDASKQSSRKVTDFLFPWAYLRQLSTMGQLSHDPLSFDPFEKRPLTVVAKEIGAAPERIPTLHPEDFGNLLACAANYLIRFSDHIVEFYLAIIMADKSNGGRARIQSELVRGLQACAPPGCPKIWAHWANTPLADDGAYLSLGKAVKHLIVAAGTVIGSLSARRLIEVDSLQAGCAVELAPGVWSLRSYIAKNLRDFDVMPVPSLVAKAVAVLERLSAPTRAKTKTAWIFQVMDPEGAIIRISWSEAMNEFAKFMSLSPSDEMTTLDLTFPQLRRGFAIFYYYGFRLGSLDALSVQLWHLDPSRTRTYVFEAVKGRILSLRDDIASRSRAGVRSLTEEERTKLDDERKQLEDLESIDRDWEEVRCESVSDRLLRMWTGKDVAVGKGGKKLFGALVPLTSGLAEAVSVGPRANDPDAEQGEFIRRAKDWARTNMLEPVPGVPVHCTCREGHQDDLDAAACLQSKRTYPEPAISSVSEGDRLPDMAYASTYVCLECVHCAVFEEGRRKIQATLGKLSEAAGGGGPPDLRGNARSAHDRLAASFDRAIQEVEASVGLICVK